MDVAQSRLPIILGSMAETHPYGVVFSKMPLDDIENGGLGFLLGEVVGN